MFQAAVLYQQARSRWNRLGETAASKGILLIR